MYANSEVYEGSWKQNLKDLKGKMKFANGDIYEGDFIEDKMDGKGKMIFH